MALPTSGPIKFSQLRTETVGGSGSQSLKTGSISLGKGTAPYSISELRGLPLVSTISINDKSSLVASTFSVISNLTISSNIGWTTTSTSWLSPSPSNGTSGVTSVTISVSDNTGSNRSGSVIFNTLDETAYDSHFVTQDACLSPDTPITMGDGSLKILGDIVLGDIVKSFKLEGLKDDESNVYTWNTNEINGELATAKVVKLINGSYKEYYIINNIMKVTFEHHILILRDNMYKFIPARDIEIGDCFWSDEIGNVEILTKEFIKEEKPFITMDVEETDVYFAHGLLVHNPAQKIIT